MVANTQFVFAAPAVDYWFVTSRAVHVPAAIAASFLASEAATGQVFPTI